MRGFLPILFFSLLASANAQTRPTESGYGFNEDILGISVKEFKANHPGSYGMDSGSCSDINGVTRCSLPHTLFPCQLYRGALNGALGSVGQCGLDDQEIALFLDDKLAMLAFMFWDEQPCFDRPNDPSCPSTEAPSIRQIIAKRMGPSHATRTWKLSKVTQYVSEFWESDTAVAELQHHLCISSSPQFQAQMADTISDMLHGRYCGAKDYGVDDRRAMLLFLDKSSSLKMAGLLQTPEK
jgi:hypothetical protein